MRTLLVVRGLEAPEARCLRARRGCRRARGVLQERQVQPLVPAVLLRLAGAMRSGRTPALITLTESRDSRPHPSSRTADRFAEGEPSVRRRSAASAAGHARGRRRRGSARRARRRDASPPGSAAGTAAVRVAERIDAGAVGGAKPALEVHRPDIVGRIGREQRSPGRRPPATAGPRDRRGSERSSAAFTFRTGRAGAAAARRQRDFQGVGVGVSLAEAA